MISYEGMQTRATYRIIDGEPVRVSAEYADVPVDTIAQMLIRGFIGVPALQDERTVAQD